MELTFFESELKVMRVLWREGACNASHIADVLRKTVGWNINTTYTVIKKCIAKGAIERTEPKFFCRPLVSEKEAQKAHTDELVNDLYGGSVDKLFAALIERKKLPEDKLNELRKIIGDLDEPSENS